MLRSDECMLRIGKIVDETLCGEMSRRHSNGVIVPLTNIEMLAWSMYKRATEKEVSVGRTDKRN